MAGIVQKCILYKFPIHRALLTSIHGASTKGIINWFNGAAISKQRLGGRRIGFCKRLRVDGGEDAEIMSKGEDARWLLGYLGNF
ncbi:unnamed protein product [Prunus armeniaca]